MVALGTFIMHLKKKKLEMVEGDWFSIGTLPLSIPLRLSEKNLPSK
jgi:hypothetical protein